MNLKDTRIKMMNEVLNGIKVRVIACFNKFRNKLDFYNF